MFKRVVYGSGALGVLTAGYLLGSVSVSGAFAQSAPATQTEVNEQGESAALASQAKVSPDQANAAALAKFPGGTVKKTELGNENSTLAYDVQLTDSSGARQEVSVDATTGAVLATQADTPETPGAPEQPEAGDATD